MRRIHTLQPAMTVRTDGTVGLRLAETTPTAGLLIVADCGACRGTGVDHVHRHRRWRLQTQWGYLLGDLRVSRRGDALAAAERLGDLEVDWTDPLLVVRADAALGERARQLLACHGLAAAA